MNKNTIGLGVGIPVAVVAVVIAGAVGVSYYKNKNKNKTVNANVVDTSANVIDANANVDEDEEYFIERYGRYEDSIDGKPDILQGASITDAVKAEGDKQAALRMEANRQNEEGRTEAMKQAETKKYKTIQPSNKNKVITTNYKGTNGGTHNKKKSRKNKKSRKSRRHKKK